MKNIGDKIASNPIIHAIGRATGCVDPKTNRLRRDSPCNKVRTDLNERRYSDAVYDFLWRNQESKEK